MATIVVRSAVAAVLALTVATVVVAVPAHYARLAATTPPIHDITTDTLNPPQFWTMLPSRAEGNANTVEYGGSTVAQLQRAYYPEIAPVTTALPPPEACAVALAAARSMPGWMDVTAEPESWRIEASEESFWMRFTDDVSIRVSPRRHRQPHRCALGVASGARRLQRQHPPRVGVCRRAQGAAHRSRSLSLAAGPIAAGGEVWQVF
jgi:hypothetical protein